MLLACGEAPVIRAFTASPTGVDSRLTPVILSWEVEGATTVSLSTIGAVAPTGTTEVKVGETTDFELTASNEAGQVTQRVRVTALTTSISGRVLTLRGEPVAGAHVLFDGQEAGVTDATGAFSGEVLPPYQLTIQDLERNQVVHYGNLTAANVIATQFGPGSSGGTATIAGHIVGASVDAFHRVVWISNGREVDGLVEADGAFSIRVGVMPGQTERGDVVAMRYEPTTGLMPSAWIAFGRATDVLASDGAETSGVTVSTSAPTEGTVEVDVEAGALTPGLLGLVLDFGDRNHVTLGMNAMRQGASSVVVPAVPGATAFLWGLFEDGQGGRSTAYAPALQPGTTAHLHAGEVPRATAPLADATLTKTGTLTWSGGAGMCRVELRPTQVGAPTVNVLGLSEVPMAALFATRMGMKAGTYTWKVECLDRYHAPDDLVTEVWPSVTLSAQGVSAPVTFALKP